MNDPIDRMKHEILGKTIEKWFSEVDRYSFRSHLSMKENAQFDFDEAQIVKQHDELIRRYNKIASDRISRQVIMSHIQRPTKDKFTEVSRMLEEAPNETLQLILNVLNKSQEQKKEANV